MILCDCRAYSMLLGRDLVSNHEPVPLESKSQPHQYSILSVPLSLLFFAPHPYPFNPLHQPFQCPLSFSPDQLLLQQLRLYCYPRY